MPTTQFGQRITSVVSVGMAVPPVLSDCTQDSTCKAPPCQGGGTRGAPSFRHVCRLVGKVASLPRTFKAYGKVREISRCFPSLPSNDISSSMWETGSSFGAAAFLVTSMLEDQYPLVLLGKRSFSSANALLISIGSKAWPVPSSELRNNTGEKPLVGFSVAMNSSESADFGRAAPP